MNLNYVLVENEMLKLQFQAEDPEGTELHYYIMKMIAASPYMSITDEGLMR